MPCLLKPRSAEADRAAYRDYVAAKEAARVEKLKSLQQIISPSPHVRQPDVAREERELSRGGGPMDAGEISVRCCIAGGGPAGMMLGFLLARAGVDVVVLEKHADFLRDFRGDTIHPSTLEIMHELGLLDEFLQRPHQEARDARRADRRRSVQIADFSHLPTHCKFIALMPQWDFLDFIAEHAKRYPISSCSMEAEATDLTSTTARHRLAGDDARRGARSPARSRGRRRRAPFDRAREGRPRGHRFRRADGCVVDAAVAAAR